MTFEEQFPSLKEHYVEELGIILSSHMKKFCLDKQKVRSAIYKLINSISPLDTERDEDRIIANIKILEKELGL